MPVLGIDYEKCTGCGTCLVSCLRPGYYFKRTEDRETIIYEDPDKSCILCGQCIGQCPEDAIMYENMGEAFTFKNVENPQEIVSYEDAFHFLTANRSVRHYKKDKVPLEVLKKVFKAMQYAPTGANRRSERFSIISSRDKLTAISDAVYDILKGPILRLQLDLLKKTYQAPVFFDAPHVIFVSNIGKDVMTGYNIGIIVTYGRLAAQALGLGTCWVGMMQVAIEFNPKIKRLAGIRGNAVGAFAVGYPDLKYYRVPPRAEKKTVGLEE